MKKKRHSPYMKQNDDSNDDDGDALHIAVSLHHLQDVKDLLANNFNLVQRQDKHGDQAAHIAAKLGYMEIMKLLVEYDAPQGRRNYDGFTPIGLARMHGHGTIVTLLKDHYDWNKSSDDSNIPGPERHVPRKYGPTLLPSQFIIRKEEKRRREEKAKADSIRQWQRLRETQCACKLQSQFRRRKAQALREKLKFENDSALVIQKAWRWRYRDEQFRRRQRASRKIQSFQRMVAERSYWNNFNRDRLWWYRATRTLATIGQRLWRGHVGRSAARRHREMVSLPNPDDARCFDEWVLITREATRPKRVWGIYAEFILSGTPQTWSERAIKRNGYFRDVLFYVNSLTKRVMWEQPTEWSALDHRSFEERQQVITLGFTLRENSAAERIQSLYRAKVARRNLDLILRSKHVMENAESSYESNPENVIALCNYTLYVHAILNNTDKARKLYDNCMKNMEERGIDNPFILYSYSIFLAKNGEEDFDVIKLYIYRAIKVEERAQKRDSTSKRGKSYELAHTIFRHAAIVHDSGTAWHNYALCQMLVYHDLHKARKSFICALKACASNSSPNQFIIQNFNVLLLDPEYMGNNEDDHDAFDEILALRHQNPS